MKRKAYGRDFGLSSRMLLTMFTLGAAWGTAIEIGGSHIGVVGGTMNSVGNLVAMLNPLIVAYSVEWFGTHPIPERADG